MANLEKTVSPSSSEDKPSGTKEIVAPSHLQSNEDLSASFGVDEKALLRKLDLRLLPALTLLYLLSFLDRSNGDFPVSSGSAILELLTGMIVANARLEGLTTDLHMSRSRDFWCNWGHSN